MNNKYLTLRTIYELVKNDANPTASIIHPNEVIVRQSFPWDEIVKHLNKLQSEDYIIMKQLHIAAISITDKGVQYFNSVQSVNVA